MRDFPPWARTEAERAAIEAEARSICGETISAVEYLFPHTISPGERRTLRGFDEVNWGVQLQAEAGHLFSAAWYMVGPCEGLSFGRGPAEARNVPAKRFAVTDRSGWPNVTGSPIKEVTLGWNETGETAMDAVCLVQLGVQNGAKVTIALGRPCPDGQIEYLPDGLVVIFDGRLAEEYRARATRRAGTPAG